MTSNFTGEFTSIDQMLDESELPRSLETINILGNWVNSDVDAFSLEFAICLKANPVLAERALKIASSPYFGGQDIGNVEQAVKLINSNSLTLLLLSMEIIAVFSVMKLPSHHLIWRRNIYTAATARLLAKCTGSSEDRAFITGLLRGVGRWVLYARAPEIAAHSLAMAAEEGVALIEVEAQLLGFNHIELGVAALTRWGLPAFITETINHYLTPDVAPEEYYVDAAILGLAYNQTCRFYDLPYSDFTNDYLQGITGLPDSKLLQEQMFNINRAHNDAIKSLLS